MGKWAKKKCRKEERRRQKGKLTKASIRLDLSARMAFSSDPIQESLHILEGKELHSKAVAAFLNVMKYMTDYPTRSSNLAPFAQEITKRMLGYEALRDEIFLQICKQVSNNPRIE